MLLTPEVDRGWAWVVMMGSFGSHFITGGLLFASGIVRLAILETYGRDFQRTAWISSVFLSLVSIAGPLASILINKFNCRFCMVMGGILLLVGFTSSAFVVNINWLFLTYAGIGGTGAALSYDASVVVLGFNFRQYRNMACGIAVSGLGIGLFVLAPVYQLVYQTFSLPGLFLIMAGINFNQCLFGFLSRPSRLEMKYKYRPASKQHKIGLRAFKSDVHKHFKAILLPNFLCFCTSFLFANIGISLVYLHLPYYATEKGATPMEASWLLSVIGIGVVITRLLIGVMASSGDINELVLYSGLFGAASVATLLFPIYSGTYAGQMAYSAMFGFYAMGCYVLIASLIIDMIGVEFLSSGFGLLMICCGIGYLVGPPLGEMVVHSGWTNEHAFIVAGICLLIGAVLGMLTPCFGPITASRLKNTVEDTIIPFENTNEKMENCLEKKKDENYVEDPQVNIEYEKSAEIDCFLPEKDKFESKIQKPPISNIKVEDNTRTPISSSI